MMKMMLGLATTNPPCMQFGCLPQAKIRTYICKFISQYDSIISSVLSRSLLKPQVKKAPHTAKAAKHRSSEVRGRRGRPQPSLNASTIFIFFLSLALFRPFPFLFYSIAHGHWIENMICGNFLVQTSLSKGFSLQIV